MLALSGRDPKIHEAHRRARVFPELLALSMPSSKIFEAHPCPLVFPELTPRSPRSDAGSTGASRPKQTQEESRATVARQSPCGAGIVLGRELLLQTEWAQMRYPSCSEGQSLSDLDMELGATRWR
jgi:hypothetical protein